MHTNPHGFARVFVIISGFIVHTNDPPQRSDDSNIRRFCGRNHQHRIAHREHLARPGSRSSRFGGPLFSIGPYDRFRRGSVSGQVRIELSLSWFKFFVWEKIRWLGGTCVELVRWPLVCLRSGDEDSTAVPSWKLMLSVGPSRRLWGRHRGSVCSRASGREGQASMTRRVRVQICNRCVVADT